ncbi:MAG TPA: CHAT domain-containing tetratricopeptide repeat protein [Thermoanaerobaculia bacterium]
MALARREFERALQLGQAATPEFLRGIHLNLSEVYLQLGDVGRSAHHLQEAWKRLDPGQPVLSAISLQQARLDLAREQLAEADQTLEAALSQDPEPDWGWQLEYQRGVLEERRGNLRTAESAYRKAAEIVEDLRRSTPFNELKAWLLDDKRQPFEALFLLQAKAGDATQALATADRALARTLLDAFLHSSSSAGGPWQTSSSLQRITGLESLVPAMSESPVAALQPIDRVLGAFGDRCGLVYFEAGSELWLVSVSGRRVRLHALAAPASEIRDLAERLLAHPEDRRIAARLGEILLPPDALPEKGKPIFLVADGFLGNLPFAALRSDGRYLVEDHVLLSVPSLSALAALEGSPREPSGPPLVLVDVRGDLPAAAAEGRAVGDLLRGEVQASNKATFAELKRASHARILHLAIHTGLDPQGPWLQLADRRVGASEIAAGHIGPRLTVLASCASGARSGRQMWGSLSAAFLAGGSRSVLASLWSIEDERTREFILRFYTGGGASEPAVALARAQRVAIAQGQSPTVWAPFVLFGSDRP